MLTDCLDNLIRLEPKSSHKPILRPRNQTILIDFQKTVDRSRNALNSITVATYVLSFENNNTTLTRWTYNKLAIFHYL